MAQAVIITGASGGIGRALCSAFQAAGWFVVASDRATPVSAPVGDAFVSADIDAVARDPAQAGRVVSALQGAAGDHAIAALVNNAAVQVLGGADTVSPQDLALSFNVNVVAPFALVQGLLPTLEANVGAVLNIGSVHAQATKSGFVAYATAKTALHGLTRALAVDLGRRVRVNTLAPAATRTAMLEAGFKGNPDGLAALADAHPLGRIAEPEEIAAAAVFLCSSQASFITGATIYADGGVLSRLHDPA